MVDVVSSLFGESCYYTGILSTMAEAFFDGVKQMEQFWESPQWVV